MKTFLSLFFFANACLLLPCALGLEDNELCLADCSTGECTFVFRIDIFAGDTGYYRVEGCDGISPTLGMREGTKYVFDQRDPTNWFHPLGFAYGFDGVYAETIHSLPELEKEVVPPNGNSSCLPTSCQSPQYKLNGDNLCSDNPCDPTDFGLDEYEGNYFSGARGDWIDAGNFTVEVTITDPATTELFYFCHIHNQMSGRIKVLNPGTDEQKEKADQLAIPYPNDSPSDFDKQCGTHNVSQYKDGEGCPEMTFICDDQPEGFNECMIAIDCAMHVEMRVTGDNDPTITFMHQMIAHHRNAVNMAKILLKENPGSLRCGTSYDGRRRLDGSSERDAFCNGLDGNGESNFPVIDLLWTIINEQNQQITFMEAWLVDNDAPTYDYCEHDSKIPLLVGLSVAGLFLCAAMAGGLIYYKKNLSRDRATKLETSA